MKCGCVKNENGEKIELCLKHKEEAEMKGGSGVERPMPPKRSIRAPRKLRGGR